MLEERNTRKGFFELDMLLGVLANLPEPLRPVIQFAYITGWRILSEVLPLEWRQVDFRASEIRLDPETTKNRDGRVFPRTDELQELLRACHAEHQQLKLKGQIVPWVFFRMVATKREGTEGAVRFEPSRRRGRRRVERQVAPVESLMASVERLYATWCAAVSLNVSRCSSPVTRRAPCSTATTSCRAAICGPPRRNFTD
jgi:integrase